MIGHVAAMLIAMGTLLHGAAAAEAITEEEAATIGVDAYIYFYPMVTMDVTRRQATNIEAGKVMGRGPANTFVNVPEFPTADYRTLCGPISIRFIPPPGWICRRSRW